MAAFKKDNNNKYLTFNTNFDIGRLGQMTWTGHKSSICIHVTEKTPFCTWLLGKNVFLLLRFSFRKTINILFWIFFISLQILVKTAFTFFIGESKVKCVQFSCSQLYFVSIAQFGFFPRQNHVNFVIMTQIFKTNLGKLMIEWFFIEVTAK